MPRATSKRTAKQTDAPKCIGRPTKYRADYVIDGTKLCRLGATDAQIADFFQVSESTIYLWKLQHPTFSEALKRTKAEYDGQVEQSLLRRALGYTHDSEKVFQNNGKIVRTKTIEHYPPDTTALIFWLKNRQPEQWRDKPDNDSSDELALPVQIIVEVKDARTPDAKPE